MLYRKLLRPCYLISRSFLNVCRERGVVRTAHLAISELSFDWVNGTDTSIDLAGKPIFSCGVHPTHDGSNPVIFAELVAHAPLDRRNSVFLDYGSGKGRALLLAAQHGINKAIGIEVSPALCALARKNLSSYLVRHPGSVIEVHCGDAATFDVPVEVNLAFLYNPFGPEVILRVIERIAKSVACTPRQFCVIYLNPLFTDLFVRAGFRIIYRQKRDGVVLLADGRSLGLLTLNRLS